MDFLKPCPYCGHDDAIVVHINAPEQSGVPPDEWRVACERPQCGAQGPKAEERKRAVWGWNIRASR
ncbi:MAG: Lar family restriction alleviation protein [Magnetococcales bacterium]|nr:Lar family restriction alleviation protein [Magnetococcales bacterium]